MPIGPLNTKKQKQEAVHTEMHKFKEGSLHSGSKSGPVVKNPKQAIAIALSESGQSKKTPTVPPATGKSPKIGSGESKSNYDRSSHFKGNPGFPEGGNSMSKDHGEVGNVGTEKRGSELIGEACIETASQPKGNSTGAGMGTSGAEHHKGNSMGGAPHSFPHHKGSQGFGHAAHVRSGHLRLSGHSGAHQIGKKR